MRAVKADAPKVDGRHERSRRTREAIVLALTALLDEGRIEPTAPEIAARADVALRSIAQHFPTREDLLAAVAEHHRARLPREEIDESAPLAERLASFVRQRAELLEASRVMRRAAAVMAGRSPAVEAAERAAAAARRVVAARAFAPELAKADDPTSAERALALVTSGRSWDTLRGELGLGRAAARAELERLIRRALA